MRRTINLETLVAWALLCMAVAGGRLYGGAGQAETGTAEWQPISKEELAFNDDPTNPGASAVILYREVMTDDVNSVETQFYRIKILTDAGRTYGDVVIPYLEKTAPIENIRARTVEPDGTAVEFRGEVFDKLVAKSKKIQFQAKTFTLPGVRAGCIIEYSYQLHWHQKFPDVLRHPEHYIVDRTVTFPTARWVISEDLFIRRARFTMRPLHTVHVDWDTVGLPQGRQPRWQADGSVVVLELSDLPAYTEEPLMPPERAIKGQVDFFYYVGLPEPSIYWRGMAKAEAAAYEKFIGHSKYIEQVVDETVTPGDSPEAQLRKLYARAQQIRFVSFEAPKAEEEVKHEGLRENKNAEDVLKHGYAYVNEIDLLFVAMARAAGFNSAPVRLSARDAGVFRENFMDWSQLDAMVAWVKVGNNDFYFDPATRFCPYALLPWNETAAVGLRLDGVSNEFIQTPPPQSRDSVVWRKAYLRLNEDGTLEGKLYVRFTGQESLQLRLDNRDRDEAGRRQALEEEVKAWLPEGSTAELNNDGNWEEADESFNADFTIKIANYGAATRRRLLLPLAVMESSELQAFQSSRRVHAIFFPYPYQELDEITLEVPPDRRVEALPAARSQTMSFGSYKTTYETADGIVKFERQVVMNGLFFNAEDYPQLRIFFDNVRVADEEPVVLRKAQ